MSCYADQCQQRSYLGYRQGRRHWIYHHLRPRDRGAYRAGGCRSTFSFDIWLTYHPDAVRIPRVRRMVDWLIDAFDPRRFPWFRDEFIHPKDLPREYRGAPIVNLFEGFLGANDQNNATHALIAVSRVSPEGRNLSARHLRHRTQLIPLSDSASTTSAYFVVARGNLRIGAHQPHARPWSAGRRARGRCVAFLRRARPCRRRRTSPAILSMSAICCSRPAETRLLPFSYFCTCWNVSPMPSARVDCERPRSSRRARILRPISTSSAPARRLRVAPRADSIKLAPGRPPVVATHNERRRECAESESHVHFVRFPVRMALPKSSIATGCAGRWQNFRNGLLQKWSSPSGPRCSNAFRGTTFASSSSSRAR